MSHLLDLPPITPARGPYFPKPPGDLMESGRLKTTVTQVEGGSPSMNFCISGGH